MGSGGDGAATPLAPVVLACFWSTYPLFGVKLFVNSKFLMCPFKSLDVYLFLGSVEAFTEKSLARPSAVFGLSERGQNGWKPIPAHLSTSCSDGLAFAGLRLEEGVTVTYTGAQPTLAARKRRCNTHSTQTRYSKRLQEKRTKR